MTSSQPIGIFDSGIGGLTVARAVSARMPEESILYFGDTAHLPYGDKSTAAIQAYSVRITDYLLSKGCKVILMACNSATAAAYDLVKEYVGKRAIVFDVINPTVHYIREHIGLSKIGLIGTRQTIGSGVYARKIEVLDQGISLASLATPLLVPMIEEGIAEDTISYEVIKRYLSDPSLQDIQSLILGCTHYPLIKEEIAAFYDQENKSVHIIDAAERVAASLQAYLAYHQLEAKTKTSPDQFVISDFTPSFEKATQLFFGKKVSLSHAPIWDE